MRQPRTPRTQMSSVVERRLLVNYRIDPATATALLPAPLRPQLVRGYAVAGMCLLRLGDLRPTWAPTDRGLRSENAAHRIAVEWDGPGGTVETGVYILRRDTASRISAWAGGRIFPGEHGRADFEVHESPDEVRVAFATRDGSAKADVTVKVTDDLRGSKLFDTLEEASAFFRTGSKGFSPTSTGTHLDGMELHTNAWHVEPGHAHAAKSSYFDDPTLFPPGTATLDCTLVMRNVPARWAPLPAMAVA
ncbi:DUF2071 domain-containing protein [Streptomyces sp. ISL-98]|uniref:DUF2071 domain-containing protein n=1 Tax=Streptomyces sp. ISL-98 TaxID=2819192 RepID=UPI001BE8C69D|nr:DUF2071 domain-containing protein [Streptomyces sp. ISL-98]MBT2505496.1 DUF2071 domain-containing protein [Streptomyces sp. ISL-98]